MPRLDNKSTSRNQFLNLLGKRPKSVEQQKRQPRLKTGSTTSSLNRKNAKECLNSIKQNTFEIFPIHVTSFEGTCEPIN